MCALPLPLFVLFMIVVAGCVFCKHGRDIGSLAGRLITILGISLSLESFAFLPWVRFSRLQYLTRIVLGLVGCVLRLCGQRRLATVLAWLESLGGIPGSLPVAVPGFDRGVHLMLLLVPLTGTLSLAWLVLTLFIEPSDQGRAIIGKAQAWAALLAVLLLPLSMSALRMLGTEKHRFLRSLVGLAGPQTTPFVWLAWFGLIILAIGGVIEARGVSQNG